MAGERGTAPLDDLVDDIVDRRGVTPLKLHSNFVSSGYRVISAKAIKGRRVDLSADEPRFVDEVTYRKWMSTPLRADDVILTSEAPLGEPAYISRNVDWCLGQRLFGIRSKKGRLHGRFLFYALQFEEVRNDLLSRATGTTAQGIRQSELRRVQIPLPSLDDQRAIAHILGTLDDKIELNRRMNETLEAMARALFKSWFVDFDPVRAKTEGRPSTGSGQATPSLPRHLANLFPDSFEDSELGEIPKGWEVATLADFSSLNPEAWSKATRPKAIRYVDLSNTKWGRIEAVVSYAHHEAPSRAQRVLRVRDTIVGTVRPGNGSYALIFEEGLTASTGFAVLRPAKAEYAEFVYLAATSGDSTEALSHLADGAAYPAVRPEVVAATPVVRPSDDLLERFSRVSGPLLGKIAENERQSRTLAALRDGLLPKLISGELRVNDAEPFSGTAV